MKIGIAGIGRMGAAIGLRLMEVGHELTVWKRSVAKTKPLAEAGAKVVAAPKALADGVEVIITILTDDAAIDAVYAGPSGLLAGSVKGKLVIEMSTVRPETEIALAEKVRGKGAAFVECPVGGSTAPARQGKLLGLMGAEPADAERARPLLEQLCRKVEHCGAVGAGSSMKLAINLPLMIGWQAYAEAFSLVRDLGWEPKRLVELFTESNGANNGFKLRADMIIAMLENRDPGPTTFSVANAVKDLKTMIATGTAKGADMPAAKAALAAIETSNNAGLGLSDASRQTVYWSSQGKK